MTETTLRVTGFDSAGHPEKLPGTVDDYFTGPARRFAHIRRLIMEYETPIEEEGNRILGDFALLRAFLADHDGALSVLIRPAEQMSSGATIQPAGQISSGVTIRSAEKMPISEEIRGFGPGLRLFFPGYLYGFVEDTFARAIHHKIEGIGYGLRECVGKYEIRIREYDRMFLSVLKTDASVPEEAGRIALSRLLYPMNLWEEHGEAYRTYIRERETEVLTLATRDTEEAELLVSYLTEQELVSPEAVKHVLPALADAAMAPVVAILLRYTGRSAASEENGGRMSLF